LSKHEYKRIINEYTVSDMQEILSLLAQGDFRTIARCITLVENELAQSEDLLKALIFSHSTKLVGITGPPGAGKSTIANALLHAWTKTNWKVAVVSVDPSSPFNYGALLGDRIRMSEFYLNPNVFIRSVASRGSLGGLNSKIIEIVDVLRACKFDYILIETVGVGQSEVEIAGIADTTIVVTVPEAGDEVQTMKAGVMEIADIFVVNKSDRPHADVFVKNLKLLAHSKANDWEIPVIKCVAITQTGIDELANSIEHHQHFIENNKPRKLFLLADKAFQLMQQKRMQGIRKIDLQKAIALENEIFNLYRFVERYIETNPT
jgi:LAO/AO transport system kinase